MKFHSTGIEFDSQVILPAARKVKLGCSGPVFSKVWVLPEMYFRGLGGVGGRKPFIVQGLIKALRKFPQCNAIYDEEKGVVLRHEAVHVGISTQTEDGLMVPVIKHAEARDVWDTANELRRVTSAARDKTATVDELTGSTITITSLGAMGGLGATPIINHPEVSIVSIHAARDRAVVREGEIVVRKMMNLTSSFDHRIIDGYDGALLIQELKSMLEYPATIFM